MVGSSVSASRGQHTTNAIQKQKQNAGHGANGGKWVGKHKAGREMVQRKITSNCQWQ